MVAPSVLHLSLTRQRAGLFVLNLAVRPVLSLGFRHKVAVAYASAAFLHPARDGMPWKS